jgi:hypothetical protein
MKKMNLAVVVCFVGAIGCARAGETESVEALSQSVVGSGGSPPCPFLFSWPAGGAPGDQPPDSVVATSDATITKPTPSTNLGNDAVCSVRGGSNERSCLLKFDLAHVPTDRVVTDACLQLAISDPSVRQFSPRRLLQSWTESGATWNERQSSNAWGLPGAKGATDRDTTDLAIIPGSANGVILVPFDVTVVQDWINNPSGNHGITIANSAANDGASFHSSEGAAGLAPKLLFK